MNTFLSIALGYVGEEFNPGIPAQCAEFVSHCLDAAGFTGAGYHHTAWAPDFHEMGTPVNERSALQPGDIILFDNTYVQDTFTHVGIYIGDGFMVHRPTSAKPVEKTNILDGFYSDKFHEGRRLITNSSSPSTPNDGQGISLFPVKLEWHDGLISMVIDGKEVLHTKTKNVGQGKLYLPELTK